MSVNTQKLLDRVAREFGAAATSEIFKQTFFDALDSVRMDMLNRAFVEWDEVESTDTDIDIDEKYYTCIYDGVRYYINASSEWARVPKGDLERQYFFRSLPLAQELYFDDNPPDVRMGDYDD